MELVIKVMWCKSLTAFNFFQKLKIYTIVSIKSENKELKLTHHQKQKQKTSVDEEGGGNPEWNHTMTFDLSRLESFPSGFDDLSVVFEFRHHLQLFGFKNVGEVRVPLRSLVESAGNGNVKFVSYEVRSPEGKHNGVLDFSYKVIRKDDNHLAESHNHHNNSYPLDCNKHDDHDTATTSSDRHFSECHERNQQPSSNPEKIQYPKIDVEDLSDIIPICASPIIATNISHKYSPAPVRVYPPSELEWGPSPPVPPHFPPPPSSYVVYPPPPCVDPHFGYYNRRGEYNQQG